MTRKNLGQAVCLALLVPALAAAAEPVRRSGEHAPRASRPRHEAPISGEVLGVLTEQAKVTGVGDPIGDLDERFGSAVAAEGDTLVVGAPHHSLTTTGTGAVYVFVYAAGSWTLEAKLGPTGPSTVTGFGASVAISGDTLVVGTDASGGTLAFVFVRNGGTWAAEAQLSGSDTQPYDGFGAAVAVSGDTAVVGSPEDSTGFGGRSGSVYVFARTGGVWAQQQKLLSADLAADDAFGRSVSISGDTLVAGAPGDDTGVGLDAGSAYVFARAGTAWTQQAKLVAPSAADGDNLGWAVSIDVDSVAVGARGEGDAGSYAEGAVYVFLRVGPSWSLQQRLAAAPGLPAEFGASLALRVDTLIVGAPLEGPGGAAHVLSRSGGVWTEEQVLTASVGEAGSGFGLTVAVSSPAAFVGAPLRDDSSGSAFVFRQSGPSWIEEARLDPPGTGLSDAFASAVALEGDVLVVGAPSDDVPAGRDAGSVSVFVRTGATWGLQQKIVASDATDGDRFGTSVALSGDTLAVGAPGPGYEIEAVYLFVRIGGVWQEQQKLVSPSGGLFEEFGSAVAVDADSLIVGAPGEESGGQPGAGAAYVFVRTGGSWSLQQRLVSSAPSPQVAMGGAVAIAGDTALVGVSNDGAGNVHVFQRAAGAWTQQAILSPSDGVANDGFGASLALSDDTAVVGAPYATVAGFFNAGAAYVFVRGGGGTWTEQQKLFSSEPSYVEILGASVAVSGDAALVGSGYQPSAPGFALLFERTGTLWAERQRIVAFDAAQQDLFGTSVAFSGTTAAVGAPRASTSSGFESGAAYLLVPATTDLAVGITGPPGVGLGDLVAFSIVVSNNGPDTVPAVGVAGVLDPGLVVDSISPSQGVCTHGASSASCSLGIVPAGSNATVSVVAAAVAVGVQTLEASLTWGGTDPVPANDTTSVSTVVGPGGPADLRVVKTSLKPTAEVGLFLPYRIDVTNLGPAAAAGVVVEDPTPAGITLLGTFGACSSGFPCFIPRIPAGETRTLFADYDVPASYPGPDPVVNTATVTSATSDPDASNDGWTSSTPFFVPVGNLDYFTMTPCRLLDTRDPGLGGPDPLAAGYVQLLYPTFSACGVPFGARAIAVNVTVTEPSTTGNLRLYPARLPVPQVSMVNYGAGQTRGSNGVVSLNGDGALSIRVGQPSGTVHVIVDVFGYFE